MKASARGRRPRGRRRGPARAAAGSFTAQPKELTTLRESEARFKRLANAIPALVWQCAADGAVIFFNERWYAFTGFSRKQSLGFEWVRAVHPEDRRRTLTSWELARREGKPYAIEVRVTGADGVPRWTFARAEPELDARGRILGWFGTGIDIEEKKAAEHELAAAREEILHYTADLERRVAERTRELTQMNQDLETFTYSASHDLRAPLRKIDGFCHAILGSLAESLDPRARDYFERIRAAGRHMDRLLDDMLRMARIAQRTVRREDVDVSAIAARVAEGLRKAHPGRSVAAEIQAGLHAYADPSLLGIILECLMDNAWKFTSRQPEARVEVGRERSAGRDAFYVRDNGVGFDMALVHKIFIPFERLHHAEEFPGTGVGIPIAQRAIQRQGGNLWAEGAPERGATFYFTLGEERQP